jgi:hypothetical protein
LLSARFEISPETEEPLDLVDLADVRLLATSPGAFPRVALPAAGPVTVGMDFFCFMLVGLVRLMRMLGILDA